MKKFEDIKTSYKNYMARREYTHTHTVIQTHTHSHTDTHTHSYRHTHNNGDLWAERMGPSTWVVQAGVVATSLLRPGLQPPLGLGCLRLNLASCKCAKIGILLDPLCLHP